MDNHTSHRVSLGNKLRPSCQILQSLKPTIFYAITISLNTRFKNIKINSKKERKKAETQNSGNIKKNPFL